MATTEINWWHQIELPDGTVTPGHDQSAAKLASLHLPELTDKTVLDVGALDGLVRDVVRHALTRDRLVVHAAK